MIVNDHGQLVNLIDMVKNFHVTDRGVLTDKLSEVLRGYDISNVMHTNMFSSELDANLGQNKNVILQVPAGTGYHFLIVDKLEIIDGTKYYMTRDPYSGPRGIKAEIIISIMNRTGGLNAITINN